MFMVGGFLLYSLNYASSVYILYLLVTKFGNQDFSDIEDKSILFKSKKFKSFFSQILPKKLSPTENEVSS